MEMNFGSDSPGSQGFMEHRKEDGGDACSSPRAKIFLVMTVSFVIAAVVVLVVILTRITPTPYVEPDTETQCPDVAIIGGGLAGTYMAWRLRNENLSIVLYEQTARLGGRIYTRTFSDEDDIHLELGASYFIPKLHPLLMNLTEALGLNTTSSVWSSSDASSSSRVMYYVRGELARYTDLSNGSRTLYNLRGEKEKGKMPEDLLRDTLQAAIPVIARETEDEEIHNPYDQRLDLRSALLRHLSKEAYNYIVDTSWPGDFLGSGSASQHLDYLNLRENAKVHGAEGYVTLEEGGMGRLVRVLREQLGDRNNIAQTTLRVNHELQEIEKSQDIYRLYFQGTHTDTHGKVTHTNDQPVFCASKVILAVPPESIKSLKWESLQKDNYLTQNLDNVYSVPASKLFLQYNTSWWRPSWNTVQTDTPLGQMQYLGIDANNKTVLQAMYTAEEYYEYWQRMGNDSSQIQEMLLRLSTNQTEDSIGLPIAGVFHQWKDWPYGKAWHVWKPDVDWLKSADEMLQPLGESEPVYVVGSAFAPGSLNKWMEGALHTVEKVLAKITGN